MNAEEEIAAIHADLNFARERITDLRTRLIANGEHIAALQVRIKRLREQHND